METSTRPWIYFIRYISTFFFCQMVSYSLNKAAIDAEVRILFNIGDI